MHIFSARVRFSEPKPRHAAYQKNPPTLGSPHSVLDMRAPSRGWKTGGGILDCHRLKRACTAMLQRWSCEPRNASDVNTGQSTGAPRHLGWTPSASATPPSKLRPLPRSSISRHSYLRICSVIFVEAQPFWHPEMKGATRLLRLKVTVNRDMRCAGEEPGVYHRGFIRGRCGR